MQDTSDSYRDTFGVLIPSVASELGQAKAGPKISYRSVAADGTIIEPFASAQIIWNFADDLNGFEGTTIDTDLAGPEGARGRLELGLRSMTSSGFSLDFAGSYDGIGSSDYGAWTGRASASVPLN